jgi:hypothetical protein
MRILKICPFLGVLSRRKYLLLPESFTVNRLTLVVASSIASKLRNYSEIQLRATLTCEEEIENQKKRSAAQGLFPSSVQDSTLPWKSLFKT